MKYPRASIVLFAREPVAGRVKTRLIPALGETGALSVYLRLLRRQLHVLCSQKLAPATVWVDGDPQATIFAGSGLPTQQQTGADLGRRMHNAAAHILGNASAVVIIGSDCPGIDSGYLDQALAALASGDDVVLGPALDGGYVLIGLRTSDPELFAGIQWGSNRVLQQTLAKIADIGYQYSLLGPLVDIDRPEDLPLLYGLQQDDSMDDSL